MSIPEFDKIIPVKPPKVNKKMKPLANNIGVFKTIRPPNIVAIQLKILIPVGTATNIVVSIVTNLSEGDIPEVNMWCP